MPKQKNDASKSLFQPAPGDIIFSDLASPEADLIVSRMFHSAYPHDKTFTRKFHMNRLRQYLELLELVVICNRMVVGFAPMWSVPLTEKESKTKAFKQEYEAQTTYVYPVSDYNIGRNLRKELVKRGILLENVTLNLDGLPLPYQLTERYLPLNAKLATILAQDMSHLQKYNRVRDADLARRMATTILSLKFGNPMYISEYCRANCIPYYLHSDEVDIVSSQEELEIGLRSGVIGTLKKALDKGAATRLKELETLGTTAVLPPTPIATTILNEAESAEDLNRIALQLRDDFSGFRQKMCALQKELASEDTTIAKKLSIMKEIETLAQQLWGDQAEGLRASLLQLSGLANLALTTPNPLNPGSIPSLTEKLLRLPVEKITAALRRRKIRLLLKSKTDFLQSAALSRKIADIFDVSVDEVKQSYLKDKINQPGKP